ncbi:MAG: Npt1/Npt2 family nucleotide transporter [Waddliaceae bacterium]
MKSLRQHIVLFLGMSLMLTFSYFNDIVLRDIKDALIVVNCGAEMIPQLKLATIPTALIVGLFMVILSWDGKIKRTFNVYFPINTLITPWANC